MAGAIVCLRRHFGSEQRDAERDARRRLQAKAIVAARFLRTKGSGGATVPMQVHDDQFPLRRIA